MIALKRKSKKKELITLGFLFLIFLMALIWHIFSVRTYNNKIYNAQAMENEEDTYMALVARDLATSSWKKRDFDLYGKTVDLIAITYDGQLNNKGNSLLNDWTMKINVKGDCFINQMWNGEVEIHQNVLTNEKVQRLSLADYNLEDITLDYLYDGDLLIALHDGDYIIYYPSEKFKENKINAGEFATIGGIFYFADDIDLSNYEINYKYYKTFFEGSTFLHAVVALIIFMVAAFAFFVGNLAYTRAMREMELQNRIESAESEAKAKSAFLANMSHEIRTPINTVIGLDTMILRESKEKEIKQYAKEIKNASTMLLTLINGVLDSSKMDAGKIKLIPAEYSLRELICEVISITKPAMDAKGLEFILEISRNIPDKLYGDDVRIKQIIINILTNATKYTEKGSVKFSIDYKLVDDKAQLAISVEDTGIGIKEEDLQTLATGYQRFDEEKNRKVEGTGLGLQLVKGLLGLMNSDLKVKSSYGYGSNFYFFLIQDIVDKTPMEKIDLNDFGEDEEDYVVSFTAKDAKVLVVDDNSMNLLVFEKILKETEIQITKAISGYEALELTKKEKYDLIFMDHMMPGMDGIETFDNIKKQKDGLNQNTKVIILTANALKGAKEEYMEVGFAKFLAKPIDPDELERTVMEFLPQEKVTKGSGVKKEKSESNISKAQIEGVDMSYAIEHIGNEDAVIEVIKNFIIMADDDANELDKYYKQIVLYNNDEQAIDSYRIKIHAMKSSAGLFGALQVYGAAAFLEKAAREKRVKEIVVSTPYFIEFWSNLKNNVEEFISTLSSNVGEKKEVNKDNLINLLHQLNTSMQSYDIKNADAIMNEIEKYDIKGKEEVVKQLKLSVSKLEAEKINDLCNELLK